jgi:ubiquinone/menaquinone biosynthesis C-methylase UbiE
MPSITTESDAHKTIVREEFTRQAEVYAATPLISDAQRLARLVDAIDPGPQARALEVACGPGYVAMALAARCREVVGVDLTPAPIAIASRLSAERGLTNVTFRVGSADALPFGDGEFDIAVCRFAFHHFEEPAAILAQMCRVCRRGAVVAVEDLFASEDAARAGLCNRIERLRDGSHTRALALSELVVMLARAGCEIERCHTDRLTPRLENWMANAHTPKDKAAEVRHLIEEDLRRDLSGMRPFTREGDIYFIQRTAALVCRKL